MNIKPHYIISRFTIALMGILVKTGYFYSIVLEGKQVFLVKLSPVEIIENSLIYYGSDLNAAKKASKAALGNIDMPPIKISGTLGIYWFPTMSPTSKKCIWFSLNHIKDTIPLGNSKSRIVLAFNHTITVNISKSVFKNGEYLTKDLKNIYEKRTDPTITFTYDPQKREDMVKEDTPTYHFRQVKNGIIEINNDTDRGNSFHKKK
ncbi:competence protein ComK [Bacillus sp. IITD106]|nr:competence protein ComK [Bacillus sp. IITD106]